MIKFLESFFPKNESLDQQYFIEALSLIIDGDLSGAEAKLIRTVSLNSKRIEAYLRLGDIFRDRKQTAKAIKIHRELTLRHNLDPQIRGRVYRSLFLDYLQEKNFNQIELILQHLKKIRKDDLGIYEKLIRFYEEEKLWEKAFEALSKVLSLSSNEKLKPVLALYSVEMGKQYLGKREDAKAIKLFKEAIELDSLCSPAYIMLGDCSLLENKDEDALEIWQAFIQLKPEQAHLVYDRLEKMFYEKGSYSDMEYLYRSVLDKFPFQEQTLMRWVDLLLKKGDTDKAIEKCQLLLDHSPDSVFARSYLIKILLEQGRTKETLKLLRDSVDRFIKKRNFECRSCHYHSAEPLWHCPQCLSWNSFNL